MQPAVSLRPSELMSPFEEHSTSPVTLDASIIESQPYNSTVTSSDIHQFICAHSFIFMTWLNRPFSPVVKMGSCFPRRTNLWLVQLWSNWSCRRDTWWVLQGYGYMLYVVQTWYIVNGWMCLSELTNGISGHKLYLNDMDVCLPLNKRTREWEMKTWRDWLMSIHPCLNP